ncbi:MAG: hypothetical protein GX376_08650 [Firmicutes bacterium]|nr:hypothetical protein [Bacillota bacterium]
MSKVIKSCYVKKIETGAKTYENEFNEVTAAQLYDETKAMLEELVCEAQKKANQIISEAEQEAAKIKACGKIESEKIKEQAYQVGEQAGYQKGLADGKEKIDFLIDEISQLLNTLRSFKTDYLREKTEEVIDLIFLIVEKVLGPFVKIKPEIMGGLIKNVLYQVGKTEKLVIRVNPSHLAYLNNISIEKFSVDEISFRGDASLQPGDCVLETEHGIVEAILNEQLVQLKKVLKEENIYVEL